MTELRESVRIITPGGELSGHLFVGVDGLPELRLETDIICAYPYRPATFPAVWKMCMGDDVFRVGPLFSAWRDIEDARQSIIDAQREAEQETPEPEDDITAAKRYKTLELEEETRGKE